MSKAESGVAKRKERTAREREGESLFSSFLQNPALITHMNMIPAELSCQQSSVFPENTSNGGLVEE